MDGYVWNLGQVIEKVRIECVNDASDERRTQRASALANQQVHALTGEKERQEEEDVEREDGITGGDDERST